MAERARGAGRRARRPRRGPRRTGRHRQPELGPPADRVLGGERVRARPRADQLPPRRRRDPLHRRALRRVDAARRSRARRPRWATSTCTHRFVLGAESDEELYRYGVEPRAVGRRRGRDRDHQLHQRHHGAPEGRAAHAPQPLDQLGHVRLAHGRERPRRVPAHAADVPLQRLGHALRASPRWAAQHVVLRKVDGAEILRRVDAPRRHAACAARRRSWTRCSTPPRRGTVRSRAAARVRIVVAGAPPPTRTIERVETRARLGVHPDLRPHRDVAAAHDQPAARGVRRPHARRSGHASSGAPVRPRSASRLRTRRAGRGAGAGATSCWTGTGTQPDATADAIVDGWFHTGDGGTIDDEGYLTHLRPQEGRDHQRRRERVVDRGRGRAVLAPAGRRGGGDRRARREVGRDGEGARGARAPARRHRRAT